MLGSCSESEAQFIKKIEEMISRNTPNQTELLVEYSVRIDSDHGEEIGLLSASNYDPTPGIRGPRGVGKTPIAKIISKIFQQLTFQYKASFGYVSLSKKYPTSDKRNKK